MQDGRWGGSGAGTAAAVRQWARLLAGLAIFAVTIALMIRSGLGLGPWDAFHVGIHNYTGMTVGTASIVAGAAILCGTWFLGVRPGPGTVANMIGIGLLMDLLLPWVPEAGGWAMGLAYYAVGIVISGIGTGLYISAGLGKGPRDGLMMALSERTGWPVRRVRTLIELSVLGFGWGMGGPIGVGTVIFTLSIGPAAQWGLQRFGVIHRDGTADADAGDLPPEGLAQAA